MQRKHSLTFSPRRATAKSNDRRERISGPRNNCKGEDAPHSVLTEDLVREMRAMHRPGFGAMKIMRAMGLKHLSVSTVHSALVGKTWQWVR